MITHDSEHNRFTTSHTLEEEAYVEYKIENNTFFILHTIVPKALSGKGLAANLVETAVKWAESQHLRIESHCSYADVWLKRHRN